jgi:FkbM family methyltransferase
MNFRKQVRTKLWKLLKVQFNLNSGLNILVESDNDWFVFNEIFTNKEYDEVFDMMFLDQDKETVVLDLGANVGYFAMKISDYLLERKISKFKVYSFEASGENYKRLSHRLNQGILKSKASSFHGLVGQRTGGAKLNTDTDHFGFRVSNSGKGEQVSYLDVEHCLDDKEAEITLLKCDIEGSELDFVNAYSELLRRTKLAVFEFHVNECDVETCRKKIQETGLVYQATLRVNERYGTSVEIFKRQ